VTATRAPVPYPPLPPAPGSRQQTRLHSTATACGYMSQQSGAVISPAGRSGHDNSNWLARQLAWPLCGLGGLGFAFRLGLARTWCVTIRQSMLKSGTSRERLGQIGGLGYRVLIAARTEGGAQLTTRQRYSVLAIYYTYIFFKLITSTLPK